MRVHVCPLSRVHETFTASGARTIVSLLSPSQDAPSLTGIRASNHLHLILSDIASPREGHSLAEAGHIEQLLAFLRSWDRTAPLLIHCYAGVSRSTAAAFIALCALAPHEPEDVHAVALRLASPTATPNPRLIALADAMLARSGRMIAAIAAIGRGVDCFEGGHFSLAVPPITT